MRNRTITGIKNFDALIDGGIPSGNQVALAGGPGAGKTLFSFEYLYNNAKAGNNALYFSLEETSDMIIENAKAAYSDFTDIDELIKDNKLIIYGFEKTERYLNKDNGDGGYSFNEFVSGIIELINNYNIKAFVLDSITVIKLIIEDTLTYRRLTMELIKQLREKGVTSLITMEVSSANRENIKFKPEFFVFDGIISLYLEGEGNNRVPILEVIKMRGTYHSFNSIPYDIKNDGIQLLELPKLKD